MSNNGAHVLIFPYPAQGHIVPLLDLTHQLVLHNLTITILVTPKNLPILTPLLTAHPSIQTLILPFPPHPSLPPGIENIRYLGGHANVSVVSCLSKLRGPIISWFHAHPNPPVAILSDFFLGWTNHLARELGVPRIAFYSSGAFLASVFHRCWGDLERVRGLGVVDFPDLPGSPSFKEEHLPSVFRFYKESDPDWSIVRDGMVQNFSSWGSVFNTFDALESRYMDHLRTKKGCERVYGVGPLSLTTGSDLIGQSHPTPIPKDGGCSDVLTWLDECPDGSVVYVCFGSQKFMNKDQMEALSLGLQQSRTRFVWVVKQDDESGFNLPESDRGIVIKGWAPQVPILSHRAVGGFLSHCGWNSVLEAIASGVMLLAWPMEADQFINARLMVDDMKAAVQVWEGDTVPDSDHMARVLANAIGGDVPQKERAKELRDEAIAAVKKEGSSFRDLCGLVRELNLLVQPAKERQGN